MKRVEQAGEGHSSTQGRGEGSLRLQLWSQGRGGVWESGKGMAKRRHEQGTSPWRYPSPLPLWPHPNKVSPHSLDPSVGHPAGIALPRLV